MHNKRERWQRQRRVAVREVVQVTDGQQAEDEWEVQ